MKATNKCRNVNNDPKGPYCFALWDSTSIVAFKGHCLIRACRSSKCRVTGTANDYIGKLSQTRSGRQCARWISDEDWEHLQSNWILPPLDVGFFQESYDDDLFTTDNSLSFSEKFNHHQQSKNYINFRSDVINKNQSNAILKLSKKSVHIVNPDYYNNTLYPDRSVKNASNFCRNPSRSAAGTWCYTTDPSVPQDLCDVEDCDLPGNGIKSFIIVITFFILYIIWDSKKINIILTTFRRMYFSHKR